MGKIQAFDYSVNLLQAILWQYNDATRLQSLLESKDGWYFVNQTEFWSDWCRDVFDLQTANDFGLSVWSIILNIPIIIVITPPPDGDPAWGFDDTHLNFNNGNFRSSSDGGYTLTTEQARTVLRMRYYQITSRGTIPDINRFMAILFKDQGSVYAIDGYDMTMTYVFTFVIPSQLTFIFDAYNILPRPAGVKVDYLVLVDTPWGLGEFNENFDNGSFLE